MMLMFIYTNNEHDINILKGNGFPLLMTLDNGTHVFSTKVEKDTFPFFSFNDLEDSTYTNELLF